MHYYYRGKFSSIAGVLCFCVLVGVLLLTAVPTARAQPDLPPITGEAAIVLALDSGSVLGAKNPDLRLPMASTTKIMTALVTLEQARIDDVLTVSEEAAFQEGSSMYTSPGETYTVEDMLYGLMLSSGNDAAWALAEHVSGSVPDFVALMNSRAAEIGAVNTSFDNPSGLPSETHYTTARDLSLIASAALAHGDFCQLACAKERTVPWPVKDSDKLLINHNKLLWRYEGATGVKTGFTNEAGQCLVASAERDGRQLLTVVLNSQGNDIWSDSQRLLDWGFDNFATICPLRCGERLGQIEVSRGIASQVSAVIDADVVVTVAKDQADQVRIQTPQLPATLAAPVHEGQVLGQAQLLLGDITIGQAAVVAGADVAKAPVTWPSRIWPAIPLIWLGAKAIAWDGRRRRNRMRLKRMALRYRDTR